MWSEQIRRRKEAIRLVRTVGAEVSTEFGKSQLRQLFEIASLGLRGFSASDYYVLNLYRDPSLARKYMNRRQYDAVRRKWNPPQQGIFEFNKWIFGNYCIAVGIPTPRCYGVFHYQSGVTVDGLPLRDVEDLCALMDRIGGLLVCKPIAGRHGNDVMVFDHFDPGSRALTRANGQKIQLEDVYRILVRKDFPWLLQEKVRQHRALLELHEASVNTARVITLLGLDGKVEVLGAVLRIGIGSAEIDNTSGGGIAASIDLKSGICGSAMSESTIRRMARHPDSGRQVEGFIVPYWDRMKEVAVSAHQRLPFARSLGWDVAFGEDGPVILEVNGTWYPNHLQMAGKSLWETAFGKAPDAPV